MLFPPSPAVCIFTRLIIRNFSTGEELFSYCLQLVNKILAVTNIEHIQAVDIGFLPIVHFRFKV